MLAQNLVSDKPPLGSLLAILLNMLLGFHFVGPMLGLQISSFFYEGNLLHDIQDPIVNHGVIGPLFLTQGCATLIGLILFPIIHLVAIEQRRLSPFFPSQQKTFWILFLLMIVGMTFRISISPLVEWNMNLEFPEFMEGFETWLRHEEDRRAKVIEAMTSFKSIGDLVIGLFVMALLPAIGEELVFRGTFQNEFFRGTGRIHISIWISAIIFSAIHFRFYGFIPRLLMGALFGYVYYWSGNLLIPMVAHFFNNAFLVMMTYFNNRKIIDINLEVNTSVPIEYVIVNIILTGVLLYYIWKHYRELPKRTSGQQIIKNR